MANASSPAPEPLEPDWTAADPFAHLPVDHPARTLWEWEKARIDAYYDALSEFLIAHMESLPDLPPESDAAGRPLTGLAWFSRRSDDPAPAQAPDASPSGKEEPPGECPPAA